MKKLLILTFLCCVNLAFSQVRINLDNTLSVTFPINPTKTKTDSNSYVYAANQNGGFYIVTVTKMPKRFDYASNNDSLQSFYTDLQNTTIKKVNGKLDYKETPTIADTKALGFGYSVDGKGGFPNSRFQHSVYLNKTLFTFAFWMFKDKLTANTPDRDAFFNSVSKPTDKAPEVKYSANTKPSPADSAINSKYSEGTRETLSKAGYSTGWIIGCVLMTALIVGMWVLIIKTKKK